MMTTEQVLLTIDRVAEMAAHASYDAHAGFVSAEDAWEFLRMVCDDTDGETYGEMDTLQDSMPHAFEVAYRRHCRAISPMQAGEVIP